MERLDGIARLVFENHIERQRLHLRVRYALDRLLIRIQHAQVAVEGAILLHQDDDVLNDVNGADAGRVA